MIILLGLCVFGPPAIVDVSPTHYLGRLLGHDFVLVWEVHVRLRLVFHFVLAQDRIVHIMFDVFLRPPRPILLSLHFRVLPSYVRVAHVEHGFIHDGSAEYKLVLICNFLILFVVFSVILIGQKIRLFDLEFFSVACRLLMERLGRLIVATVGPVGPFI